MADSCPACDSEVTSGASHCPVCRVSFLAQETDLPFVAPTAPHLGVYFFTAPQVMKPVADASAPQVATEEPFRPSTASVAPTSSPERRRRRILIAMVVTMAAIAFGVYLVHVSRPNDRWTLEERMYERFRGRDALAPVEIPPEFDADQRIAAFAREHPDVLKMPGSEHRALAPPPGCSIHDLFDLFLARTLELYPETGFALGSHPHPNRLAAWDATTTARWMLLLRDTRRILRDWPETENLSPHDRADRDALLGVIEGWLRVGYDTDHSLLWRISSLVEPLERLAMVACCPEDDRAAAATARLREIPSRLADVAGRLKAPSSALVLATAQRLECSASFLDGYSDRFLQASSSSRQALHDAIPAAKDALTACARALREVRCAREARIGIGPWNTAVILRVEHRLDLDAREVYDRAIEELRSADDVLRRITQDRDREPQGFAGVTDEDQIQAFRRSAARWVSALPADEGVAVLPMSQLQALGHMVAVYIDPGSLAKGGTGTVLIEPVDPTRLAREKPFDALFRKHVLAHETYPGHRMEHLFRRGACSLRRYIDDRVFGEGWGKYAEDLIHETGDCETNWMDDWTRAWHRAAIAKAAMFSLLVETGAATQDELVELVSSHEKKATVADVGSRASLYDLNYLVGRDAIEHLRRFEEDRLGPAFDLQAFHEKLLSEGPITPTLIEREWRESAR